MRRLAAVLILIAPAVAAAHDFWLERDGNDLVLRYGHRGGELLPVDRAKLRALRCGGAASGDLLAGAVFTGSEVRAPGTCGVATAFSYGGFFSLTSDGEVPLPRSKAHDVVKAWESKQFAKWVDVKSPDAQHPCGDELEIVPVLKHHAPRAGDKLSVRVLSHGAPVPGAVVSVNHRPVGETDSAGETRIKLRAAGRETLEASLRRKLATADADDLVLEASLTLEVQP